MDKNGCLIPDDEPVIVVCGASEETKKQRVFQDQISDNETNAARNERAAACIAGTGCIPAMSGGVGFGFGKVPPPAIPLEDVYRGLPEPDMVVQEGSSQEASIPPPQ